MCEKSALSVRAFFLVLSQCCAQTAEQFAKTIIFVATIASYRKNDIQEQHDATVLIKKSALRGGGEVTNENICVVS